MFKKGKRVDPNQYIRFNSSIFNGCASQHLWLQPLADIIDSQPLRVHGSNEKNPLLMLLSSPPPEIQKCIDELLSIIRALAPGEVFSVDSSKPGYKFFVLHCTWYSRYGRTVSILTTSEPVDHHLNLRRQRTIQPETQESMSPQTGRSRFSPLYLGSPTS